MGHRVAGRNRTIGVMGGKRAGPRGRTSASNTRTDFECAITETECRRAVPPIRELFANRREISLRVRLTQSKSNPSPLPNSLLTGKRTGNFAKNAAWVASKTVNYSVVTGLPIQIPYSTEQGIILAKQGILAREQGILLTRTEVVAGQLYSITSSARAPHTEV
jgi:hypothetical protein